MAEADDIVKKQKWKIQEALSIVRTMDTDNDPRARETLELLSIFIQLDTFHAQIKTALVQAAFNDITSLKNTLIEMDERQDNFRESIIEWLKSAKERNNARS